jgi:hypothetical protein
MLRLKVVGFESFGACDGRKEKERRRSQKGKLALRGNPDTRCCATREDRNRISVSTSQDRSVGTLRFFSTMLKLMVHSGANTDQVGQRCH